MRSNGWSRWPQWGEVNTGGPETAAGTLFAVCPHKGEVVGPTGLIVAWADQGPAGGDLIAATNGAINALGSYPIAFLVSGYDVAFSDLAVPYTIYMLWSDRLAAEGPLGNWMLARSTSGAINCYKSNANQKVVMAISGPAITDDEWYVMRIVATGGADSRIGFYDGTTLTEVTGTISQAMTAETLTLLSWGAGGGGPTGRIGWLQMVDDAPDNPADDWILKAIARRIPRLPDYAARVSLGAAYGTYDAHGTATRSGNTLIAVFRRGPNHFNMPDDPGDLYMSTATAPGATWSAPVEIFTDDVDSYDARGGAVAVLASGRWIVLFFLHDGTNYLSYVITSDDEGSSWSAKIEITTDFGVNAACGGSITQLANGDLIVGLYGDNVVRLSRSTDDGDTWADEGEEFAVSGLSLDEPVLGHLDDETVMMLARVTSNFSFYRAVATYNAGTGALTWGSLSLVTTGSGMPQWTQWSDGTITLCCRSYEYKLRNSNHTSMCIKTSTDRGATWGDEEYPYPDFRVQEYGNAVELADGSRYLFYQQEQFLGSGVWWGPL